MCWVLVHVAVGPVVISVCGLSAHLSSCWLFLVIGL